MNKLFYCTYISIFIYSRAGSKRLKDKYKAKVGEYTILELLIIRLLNTFDSRMVKLCVPKRDKKKYLNISNKFNISLLTGSENDLIQRTLTNIHSEKAIVRVTADDPLTSPELIIKFINLYKKKKYDYIYTNDYSDGLLPELFSLRYLNKIYGLIKYKKYSNYLTFFLIRDIKNFNKYEFKSPSFRDTSNISFSIDYKSDLIILRKFFNKIKYDYLISTKKILQYVRKNKKLFKPFKKKNFFMLKTKNYDVSLKNDTKNKIFF